MSLVTLEKRLSRLEKEAAAVLNPEPFKTTTLVAGVSECATPAERQAYAERLAKAKAQFDKVIVLVPVKPKLHRQLPGVEFVTSQLEAQLAVATNNPSEQGNANQLGDILDGLSGNVFKPVPVAKQPKN